MPVQYSFIISASLQVCCNQIYMKGAVQTDSEKWPWNEQKKHLDDRIGKTASEGVNEVSIPAHPHPRGGLFYEIDGGDHQWSRTLNFKGTLKAPGSLFVGVARPLRAGSHVRRKYVRKHASSVHT